MSKGKKILILVLLLLFVTPFFKVATEAGEARAAGFVALITLGLMAAIVVVALSRRESRRR